MKLSLIINLLLGKFIVRATRLSGRGGGTALPGLIAEKIDPNVGQKLADRLLSQAVIVTGTNGKTTTARMLREIAKADGQSVVANKAGSNMSRGVVSALLEQSQLRISQKSIGLFEIDEASMPRAVEILKPKLIIVLNLHRDQLDRYGELDTTARLIGNALAASQAEVLLNADDPLVASLASYVNKQRVHYFGFQSVDVSALEHDHAADSLDCPLDSRALNYTKRFYSHIGHYRCPNGDFTRPKPYTRAKFSDQQLLIKDHKINLKLPGLYNAYNALASFVASQILGVPAQTAIEGITASDTAFGRIEKLRLGNHGATLLLIKNPTGFNQIIQTFLINQKSATILFLINDKFADGRDISWLWDAALEELKPQDHRVYTGGLRGKDMALRLKYAEVEAKNLGSIKSSLKSIKTRAETDKNTYIIATYTAMRQARALLKEKAGLAPEWEG